MCMTNRHVTRIKIILCCSQVSLGRCKFDIFSVPLKLPLFAQSGVCRILANGKHNHPDGNCSVLSGQLSTCWSWEPEFAVLQKAVQLWHASAISGTKMFLKLWKLSFEQIETMTVCVFWVLTLLVCLKLLTFENYSIISSIMILKTLYSGVSTVVFEHCIIVLCSQTVNPK